MALGGNERQLMDSTNHPVRPPSSTGKLHNFGDDSGRLDLSIVVACFNMKRELPRTLKTLSPEYQQLPANRYEVIVADNGSTEPFDLDLCQSISPNISFRSYQTDSMSPALALNDSLARASGRLLGVMIDGARMASPGLLRSALEASRFAPQPIVATWGFHLGHEVQMESVRSGYCQGTEDQLLESVDWQGDGYSLFEISCFAGSSRRDGWSSPPNESNAMFMSPGAWHALGGFDTRFETPGGGLVNLDLWNRAVTQPDSSLIMLLGEGTFHQVHGGAATSAVQPKWPAFSAEYKRITGEPYKRPSPPSLMFGNMSPRSQAAFRSSIERWTADQS